MKKINIAIVSPAYNEEVLISKWIRDIDSFFKQHEKIFGSVTLIVVDDGSKDGTSSTCQSLVGSLSFVKLKPLRLARNFGHQAALICGLHESLTLEEELDCVVTMDSDGEHPASVILSLIPHWQHGDQIVHTVRNEDSNLPVLKRLTSRMFYWFIQRVTGLPIQSGMADFKLWDAKLLREVASYLPGIGSLRLFAVFINPHSSRVSFDQKIIAGRVSRFSTKKMFSLALQSIVFYSALPMRIIGIVGALSVTFSLVILIHTLFVYLNGQTVPGWSSVMIAISFFSGANAFCLYFIAEYLLRMNFRAKLPLYVKR